MDFQKVKTTQSTFQSINFPNDLMALNRKDSALLRRKVKIGKHIYDFELNYGEIQSLFERGEKCITTKYPVSISISLKFKLKYERSDILRKYIITYYPLNNQVGYLQINLLPLRVIQDQTKIRIYENVEYYNKILVNLKEMLTGIFSPIFKELVDYDGLPYVNIRNVKIEYFIDSIKRKLGLTNEDTIKYLNELNDDEIDRMIIGKPRWKLLLYGWEPANVKRILTRKFFNGKTVKALKTKLESNGNIQRYFLSLFSGIISFPLLRYTILNIRGDKINLAKANFYHIYFSVLGFKMGVCECALGLYDKEPLIFHISNLNGDFKKIRKRLEELIPNEKKNIKMPTLNLSGRNKILKTDFKIVCNKTPFSITVDDNYIDGIVDDINITGIINGKNVNLSKRINEESKEIILTIYKSIMEFITSEKYIDINTLLKMNYYKDIDYKSVLKNFKSDKIEDYLGEEYKIYFEYLRNKKLENMNKFYRVLEYKIDGETKKKKLEIKKH